MEDRAFMNYDGLWRWQSFEFFAFVPEILSPKHHEIHEFAKNYHFTSIL
jgi:hypothetical protein